jgi:hypothetical protein
MGASTKIRTAVINNAIPDWRRRRPLEDGFCIYTSSRSGCEGIQGGAAEPRLHYVGNVALALSDARSGQLSSKAPVAARSGIPQVRWRRDVPLRIHIRWGSEVARPQGGITNHNPIQKYGTTFVCAVGSEAACQTVLTRDRRYLGMTTASPVSVRSRPLAKVRTIA